MSEETERDRVDEVVRSWIGTPYHDLGEIKGVGVDCGKLMKCVFAEAGLVPNFKIADYSPQHYLHDDAQRYLGYVLEYTREVPRSAARHGDIVLYWIGRCFAHGAIIIRPGLPHVVHAHSVAGRVRRGYADAVHLGMPIKEVKFFSYWGRG